MTAVSERSKSTPGGGGDLSLGQMVRQMVADTPGLPKPTAREADPFEADFGGASLPSLSSAGASDSPVALRRRDESGDVSARSETGHSGHIAPVSGERGVFSWNGGCQRAFDASAQNIGDKPPAKDASGADYTRALGRLDVASCGPQAHTSIDVCVAVSEGRAVGATVHTTPSSSSLSACLLRKVQRIGFPPSGGTDLVRTHYQVD